ncbi:hypothetical protein [Glaciecola sp. KUL10]|uniref:hypothetical protein n=1 Tax=Glaciecola sp. (strain KUL10) TaxID=2161813 RepID=UPI000D7877BC|nr:hypothetical protein [Glaciecola sp. KUL10]GBL04938.1 DNA endonuclease V [Glaciecola sp. KUL10]
MTDVYQDFLPPQHFADLKRLMMTNMLPWYFTDRVVSTEKHFMFGHTFMENGQVVNPKFFEPVRGMLLPMQDKVKFIGVSRIRAVMYTNQGKEIVHPTHVDIPLDSGVSDKFRIAVFHLNTCNGKTVIGDESIESKENQLIIFKNVPHYGTVQTDSDTRVVLNFALRIE